MKILNHLSYYSDIIKNKIIHITSQQKLIFTAAVSALSSFVAGLYSLITNTISLKGRKIAPDLSNSKVKEKIKVEEIIKNNQEQDKIVGRGNEAFVPPIVNQNKEVKDKNELNHNQELPSEEQIQKEKAKETAEAEKNNTKELTEDEKKAKELEDAQKKKELEEAQKKKELEDAQKKKELEEAQKIEEQIIQNKKDAEKRASILKELKDNVLLAKEQHLQETDKDFKLEESPAPDSGAMYPLAIRSGGSYLEIIKNNLKLPTEIASSFARNSGSLPEGPFRNAHFAEEINFIINGRQYPSTVVGILNSDFYYYKTLESLKNNLALLKEIIETENKQSLTEEGIYNAIKKCFEKLEIKMRTFALIIDNQVWVATAGDEFKTVFGHKEKTMQLSVNKPLHSPNTDVPPTDEPIITNFPLSEINNGYLVILSKSIFNVTSTREMMTVLDEMENKENITNKAATLIWSVFRKVFPKDYTYSNSNVNSLFALKNMDVIIMKMKI